MEETVNEATKRAKDFKEEMQSKAEDFFQNLNSQEQFEDLKKNVSAMAEDAAIFIKKYPIPSVFGALAVGYFLGSLRKK